MNDNSVVKQVFKELVFLHDIGINTWITKVYALADMYNINLNGDFRGDCYKEIVYNCFARNWYEASRNIIQNPKLRLYSQFKDVFALEPYLIYNMKPKYRISIARLRASSHRLAIERGRYQKPPLPVELRLCPQCNVIEDEVHFVMSCEINSEEREHLFDKINGTDRNFQLKSLRDKFLYLIKSLDDRILSWFGKFLHVSFRKRNTFVNSV